MNLDIVTKNERAQQANPTSPSTERGVLSYPTVAQDNIIVDQWGAFDVEGDRTQAIAELFKTNPVEQHEQNAWVERMTQEHPRDHSMPADAPSVKSLIFESNLAYHMAERARAA